MIYLNNRNKDKPWPAFVRLQKNELLSSWLIRNAHAHFVDIKKTVQLGISEIFLTDKDPDKVSDIELFRSLIKKTATTSKEVKKTFFSKFEHRHLLVNYSFQHQCLNKKGIMCCPICLKRDMTNPYFRKEWRLSISFLCPVHKVYLIERCPKCKSPIYPFKCKLKIADKKVPQVISLCYKCRYNFQNIKTIKCEFKMVRLQNQINNLFLDKKKVKASTEIKWRNIQQIISVLQSNRKDCLLIRNWVLCKIYKSKQEKQFITSKVFNKMDVLQRANFLLMANWLIARKSIAIPDLRR